MEKLTKPNYFADNGESKRECENFQRFIFKDIDLSHREDPISFFRSDFRGTKIVNVHFSRNNFNRADFVNSIIMRSSFTGCKYGTDFINCLFEDVKFTDNQQKGSSIIGCVFENCQFEKESFTDTTMRNCEFNNCSFLNCVFEMNTFDELSFTSSKFSNINFANMGAYNFYFVDCIYDNFNIDPDYLGTYLFKNSFLREITFYYRGKLVRLDLDYIDVIYGFIQLYGKAGRYIEMFNLIILYNYLSGSMDSLQTWFINIMEYIFKNNNTLENKNNIKKIFTILVFYINSNMIQKEDYFYFVMILEDLFNKVNNFEEKLIYFNQLNTLKANIEKNFLNWGESIPFNSNTNLYIELTIDDSKKDLVLGLIDSSIQKIGKEFYDNTPNASLYNIVGFRKGSLVISIISTVIIIYTLITYLKKCSKDVMITYFNYKVIKLSYVANTFPKLKKIGELINISNAVESKETTEKQLSIKKENSDISTTINALSNHLKQVEVFVNAINQGG
jgi:uncharacterized protein YjbI with pentapeptide repeats